MVTGQSALPDRQPCQQATPESVLAGILQYQADDMSATEQIRHAQDWAGETGQGRLSDDLPSLQPIRTIRLDVIADGRLALHMPVPYSVPGTN